MTQDVRLTHVCPHLTIEERVFLATDRRTLPLRQLLGAAASVRITANDVEIPPGGLSSQASVTGAFSGPFRVLRNENDVQIQGSRGTVTLSLPIGNRVTVENVIQLFKAAAGSSQLEVSHDNRHLVFTDRGNTGRMSRIKVLGRGAGALGFGEQSGAKGHILYPGWGVIQLEGTVFTRVPKFNAPLKSNPILKVTYTAEPHNCLRCQSSGLENDYRFDPSGDVQLIIDDNLLYQTALKIVLTQKGSNPFHPAYGTLLHTRVGRKALGNVSSAIEADVRQALRMLQTLQRNNVQNISLKERLYQITSINVSPHAEDPTIYLLDIVIQNASKQPIEISIIFTTRGVFILNADGTVANFEG